ncbi:MAG: hypothetical protein P8X74_21585 [Reinekea sp.]
MDTEVFLSRCEEIEEGTGLADLADDLYLSLDEGEDGPERDALVNQAKEKIRLYNALWADLETQEEDIKQRRQKEVKPMCRYIESMQEDLEAMGRES